MTEAEWNTATDPQPMLEFLRGKVSDRKLRLFAVACCRRIWHLQVKEGQQSLEVAEQFADGYVGEKRLCLAMSATDNGPGQDVQGGRLTATYAAHLACMYPWNRNYSALDPDKVSRFAAGAVYRTLYDAATIDHKQIIQMGLGAGERMIPAQMACNNAKELVANADEIIAAERTAHAHLLRDILSNLFRPVTFDAACLTPTVTSLATAIYEERVFNRLPLLADALEDSGCSNQEVLSHLRGGGEHTRGCWPVDLLLGKE